MNKKYSTNFEIKCGPSGTNPCNNPNDVSDPSLNPNYFESTVTDTEGQKYGKIIDVMRDQVKKISATPNNFLDSFNNLKTKYSDFVTKQFDALGVFNDTINNLTSVVKEFVGDGDAFSFLNCHFINTDKDILLKYLKEALGKHVYKVGIFLLIAACGMAFSISFIILEVMIINNAVDKKIEENKKLSSGF